MGPPPSYCSLQSYSYLKFVSGRHYASHQLLEFTFLSIIAYGATKILSTVGVDILIDRSFHSYENTDNFKSWRSCSYQSYQKSGRHYTSHQLSELTFLSTIAFRATKILSTVGVDIPVNHSFQSYQSPDNFKSWRPCSFQSYLTPGKHYASCQLLELTT